MGELAALTAALTWAVAVGLIRMAPVSMPPSRMIAIRLIAPAVATPILMFASGLQGEFLELRWQNFAGLGASVAAGVGAGDILLFRAMRTVGLIRSYSIGGTFPLFGLFYAAILLGESVGGLAIAGTIFIVIGGALVSARSATDEPIAATSRWAYRRGLGLALIVAMLWGIDLVLLKIGVGDAHPIVANSFRMPFAAVALTAFAWRVSGEFPLLRVSPRVAATLLRSGLLGLTAGSMLYLFSISGDRRSSDRSPGCGFAGLRHDSRCRGASRTPRLESHSRNSRRHRRRRADYDSLTSASPRSPSSVFSSSGASGSIFGSKFATTRPAVSTRYL